MSDNKLVQRIVEENEELKAQLKTIQAELESAEDRLSTEVKLNETATKKISEAEEKAAELEAKLETAESEAEEKVADAAGALTQLKEVISDTLGGDEDQDPADVVREVSEKMHKIIEEHNKYLEINESVGDVVSISEAVVKSGATPDRLVQIFEEYGNAEEMADAIDKGTEALMKVEEDKKFQELVAVCAEYGVDEDQVRTLMEKFNITDAEAMKEFFELTGRAKVEAENPTVPVGESFQKMLNGSAFARREINENYEGKFERERPMGHNSPERAMKLLG